MPLHELHLNPTGELVLDNLGSAPSTTTDKLYNVGGDLFFDGFQLNTSTVNDGTLVNQTLRWNGSEWVPSSSILNADPTSSSLTVDDAVSLDAFTTLSLTASNSITYSVDDGTDTYVVNHTPTNFEFPFQIQIGALSTGATAAAGMIRWVSPNFQGYNGTAWENLNTGASVSAGTAANNTLRWDGANWVENDILTISDTAQQIEVLGTSGSNTGSYVFSPAGVDLSTSDGTAVAQLNMTSIGEFTFVVNDGTNNYITTLTPTNADFSNQIQVGTLNGGATAANGMIRLNSTDIEGYADGSWQSLTYGDEEARQSIQIGTASTSFLTYDNLTGDLDVTALAITSVDVDTATYVDFNAFITANYTGTEYQEGDVVILTDVASEQRTYIHNGGSAGTAADFSLLEAPNLTDAYIRGLFTAGSQLAYNTTTGEFSVDQASFRVPVLGTATNQTLRWDGTDWQDTSVLLLDDTSGSELSTFTGKILVGNSSATDAAGQIRWNGTNFQGYDGSTWNSFDTGASVAAGTSVDSTLRWDGSSWVENTNLLSNGTDDFSVTSSNGTLTSTITANTTTFVRLFAEDAVLGSDSEIELEPNSFQVRVDGGTDDSQIDIDPAQIRLQSEDGTNTSELIQTPTEFDFDIDTSRFRITSTNVLVSEQIQIGGLNPSVTEAGGMIRFQAGIFEGYDGTSWIEFGGVENGTATDNTLRWDGTNWVESTNLTNDDTTVTVAGEFVHEGSLTHSTTSVTTGTTTLTTSDYLILCDTSGGSITLNLPAGGTLGTGFVYVIKDTGSANGTDTITIDPNASETVEGNTTVVMNTAYDTIKLVWSGSEWLTIV